MRKSAVFATMLLFVCFAAPSFAEDDTGTAIMKSIGTKGGEAAAKALATVLYDTSCKNVNLDAATGYICKILGSQSGRAEEEWKADVTRQLNEINSKLNTIETTQQQIKKDLATNHAVMSAKVDQVAADVIAIDKLVRVEGLWEKYQAQFDKIDADVQADSMLAFAKEIIANEPHTILTQLNVLLTNPPKGQPLVKYPFHEWRLQNSESIMQDRFNPNQIYDFAEKKFIEYRSRQQKAYVMYLWAAAVLESQCRIHPTKCTPIPRPLKDFQADYERYTRLQAEAFNSAVDWLVLSYGPTRANFNGNYVPLNAMGVYLRANVLTSTIVGNGEGLWGRVISMGNAWDGTLQVTCGSATQTLTPVLKYTAPVAGSGQFVAGPEATGPMDWWVSTAGNLVYDEVRFSDRWQMYHYSLPSANEGPCTVAQKLPKGGMLPWVQPDARVMTVTPPNSPPVRVGSFVAVQRAGGNYALVSGGGWSGSREPERVEDGGGQREKVTYEWIVLPDKPQGPWIGILNRGRGEYKLTKGTSRIHNKNRLLLTQSKQIRFPEDRTVKLNYFPGSCAQSFCSNGSSILKYDIENNDTESKKGKLDARASIMFRDTSIDDLMSGPGMHIDGSYGKTGDHKTLDVKGPQVATMEFNPSKKYQMVYEIYIDLETEGRGLDATEYFYQALLAPGSMYFTK